MKYNYWLDNFRQCKEELKSYYKRVQRPHDVPLMFYKWFSLESFYKREENIIKEVKDKVYTKKKRTVKKIITEKCSLMEKVCKIIQKLSVARVYLESICVCQ